jgi:hypothetical protein
LRDTRGGKLHHIPNKLLAEDCGKCEDWVRGGGLGKRLTGIKTETKYLRDVNAQLSELDLLIYIYIYIYIYISIITLVLRHTSRGYRN